MCGGGHYRDFFYGDEVIEMGHFYKAGRYFSLHLGTLRRDLVTLRVHLSTFTLNLDTFNIQVDTLRHHVATLGIQVGAPRDPPDTPLAHFWHHLVTPGPHLASFGAHRVPRSQKR